ncbi:hypothetical protein BDZ85DRAFT_258046 [Elsinoe ampelina]|uniref:Adenosine deaminase domain-containing protein n=1 Tax=Elsinoe ampelina TaxID=302913 RepID=A0A6A6GJ35_9PEZI|nr:hypothetical protein BDZ85DRAFT_258046 [Elsinoe ampelina]
MMGGFRRAQVEAEGRLGVKSAWIMCFLRDESVESAREHYEAALEYRDMVVGIGLDSNEDQRPPLMFEEIFRRAREDGFRLTAHCDVGKAYPVENCRQVICSLGKTGADRIDHGLNVVEDSELMEMLRKKEMGMTICPWSYIRHQPLDEVFQRIRQLFDAGILISIASDDPTFMEDTWILENLLVVMKFCNLTDQDLIRLTENAIRTCWASEAVKKEIMDELEDVKKECIDS